MSADNPLRLIALDTDDLPVISAHVQDAVAKPADFAWLPNRRRFVIGLNRFAWEASGGGRRRGYQRRLAALCFEHVRRVRSTGLDPRPGNQVLSLLAIRFHPDAPPSGEIEILFSGGATLLLAVECVEAQLTDLGPAWPALCRPRHPGRA